LKIITIIQARMGSERLPGKVLLPLKDTCILDYVVSRCQLIQGDEVIVATSTLSKDDPIEAWCNKQKVTLFRGSETDVLARYYDCAVKHQADYIIRVTADCPFIDYNQANEAIEVLRSSSADIVIFPENQPRGLTVDVMSYDALERMNRLGKEQRHREHVIVYAEEFTDQFNIVHCDIPSIMKQPQLRITVDTGKDYELCCVVAQAMPDKCIQSSKVVEFLLQHPEISAINGTVAQKAVH